MQAKIAPFFPRLIIDRRRAASCSSATQEGDRVMLVLYDNIEFIGMFTYFIHQFFFIHSIYPFLLVLMVW